MGASGLHWVPRSSQPGLRELGVGAEYTDRADVFYGRRSSEKASLRMRPPAARLELASSPKMSATDSTSSTPLGGLTVLPSSTSSSGSYPCFGAGGSAGFFAEVILGFGGGGLGFRLGLGLRRGGLLGGRDGRGSLPSGLCWVRLPKSRLSWGRLPRSGLRRGGLPSGLRRRDALGSTLRGRRVARPGLRLARPLPRRSPTRTDPLRPGARQCRQDPTVDGVLWVALGVVGLARAQGRAIIAHRPRSCTVRAFSPRPGSGSVRMDAYI